MAFGFGFNPAPQQQPLTGGGQQAYANTGANALTQGMQSVAKALQQRGRPGASPYGQNTSNPYWGGAGGAQPGLPPAPGAGGNVLNNPNASPYALMNEQPAPQPTPVAPPPAPQPSAANMPAPGASPAGPAPTPQPQGFQPPAGGAPMPPVRPTTGAFAQPGASPFGGLPSASAFNSVAPTPPSTPVTGAAPNAAFGALPNAGTFGASGAPAAPGGPTPAMLQAMRGGPGAMPQMTMPPAAQPNPMMGGVLGPFSGGWG